MLTSLILMSMDNCNVKNQEIRKFVKGWLLKLAK